MHVTTGPDPARVDRTASRAGSRDELVLDQIRDTWDAFYDTGFAGGAYRAHRLTGGPLLTADTPGGLASAIWDDYTRRRRIAGYPR